MRPLQWLPELPIMFGILQRFWVRETVKEPRCGVRRSPLGFVAQHLNIRIEVLRDPKQLQNNWVIQRQQISLVLW